MGRRVLNENKFEIRGFGCSLTLVDFREAPESFIVISSKCPFLESY